jgi:hypothetical protein
MKKHIYSKITSLQIRFLLSSTILFPDCSLQLFFSYTIFHLHLRSITVLYITEFPLSLCPLALPVPISNKLQFHAIWRKKLGIKLCWFCCKIRRNTLFHCRRTFFETFVYAYSVDPYRPYSLHAKNNFCQVMGEKISVICCYTSRYLTQIYLCCTSAFTFCDSINPNPD